MCSTVILHICAKLALQLVMKHPFPKAYMKEITEYTEISDKEACAIVEHAIDEFEGASGTLASAIGSLFIGRRFGWRCLYLLHDKRTLRKYESILGINFRERLPAMGPDLNRSYAWKAVQAIGSFWKVVKGDAPGRSTEIASGPKLGSRGD